MAFIGFSKSSELAKYVPHRYSASPSRWAQLTVENKRAPARTPILFAADLRGGITNPVYRGDDPPGANPASALCPAPSGRSSGWEALGPWTTPGRPTPSSGSGATRCSDLSASKKARSTDTPILAGNRAQGSASPAATTTLALLRPPPPMCARTSPPRTLPSREVGAPGAVRCTRGPYARHQKPLRIALGILKRLWRGCLLEPLTFPVL